MTDHKDIQLTITAFLKSIIESGAPVEEWEARLKAALNLYHRTSERVKSKMESLKNHG